MTTIDTLQSNSSLAAEVYPPDLGHQQEAALSSLPIIDLSNLWETRGEKCSRCHWTGDPSDLFKYCPSFSREEFGEEFGVAGNGLRRPSDCVLCETIWCLLLATARREGKSMSECAIIAGGRDWEIEVDLGACKMTFGIFISSDTPQSPIDRFKIPRRHISQDSRLSQASSKWAQRRIAECVHFHPPCQSEGDGLFLPTRLVNLQPDGGVPGLRLENRGSIPPGSRYVALSYCWGAYKPTCMTTAETLEQHTKSIPWDTLPPTFQDAAKFALSLNVKYLWIDSICIIQGDYEDWQREAGRMYAIYKNSYVTFAALFGSNPASGLRTASMKQTSLPFAQLLDNQDTYTLYARRIHYFGSRDEDPFKTPVEFRTPFPLLGRAWTYQERMLSPRVIFFGEDEMVYQCLSDVGCECGATTEGSHKRRRSLSKTDIFLKTRNYSPSVVQYAFNPAEQICKKACGRRMTHTGAVHSAREIAQHDNGQCGVPMPQGQILSHDSRGVNAMSANTTGLPTPIFHWSDIAATWRDKVVAQYSLLRVTKQTDRLPALAAIAEQFQRVRQGEDYLAGLWSGSLLCDLLWCTDDLYGQIEQSRRGQGGEKLSKSAVLPTWSWASLQHVGVCYDLCFARGPLNPEAEVVEAWCEYPEENAFGVLKSSKLVLHGRILHCRLERAPIPESSDGRSRWECNIWNGNSWARFSGPFRPGFLKICMDDDDYAATDGSLNTALCQEVYILQVLSSVALGGSRLDWYFLVLHRGGKEDNIYTRGGYLELSHTFGDGDDSEISDPREASAPDAFMKLFREHSVLATCEIR